MTSVEGEWLAELGPMFYVVKDRGGSSASAKAAAATAVGSARAASNPLLTPYTPGARMLRSERHAAAMREMSAMEEEMQRAGEADEASTSTRASSVFAPDAFLAPSSERNRRARTEIVTPGRSARSDPASAAEPPPTPGQCSVRKRIRSSLRAKFEGMTPASGAPADEGAGSSSSTPGTA